MLGFSIITRLWRVPATLPYPDFIFTTRTLPGNFFKISGFWVVTTHAFFSPNQNVHPTSPIPYSEIEFRPQTTFSTCHQKFAFRPVDGSASDLRVIKNCSHITSKSLRVIVDELAMFWQFIKNCSQTFGSGLRANFDELTRLLFWQIMKLLSDFWKWYTEEI